MLLAVGAVALGCGGESAGTGGGGGIPSVCDPVCDNEVECNGAVRAACIFVCRVSAEAAAVVSSECASALDALLSCAGALSCPDYEAWEAEEPPDGFPCRDQTLSCNAECDDACTL